MPLVRAWATTVHNAQGATIRSSIAIYLVDEQGNVLLFGDWCRLLYVAMSRATSSKQVYLVGFDKVDLRRLADSCREPNKRLADWMDRVQRVQEGSAEASQQSQPYDPSPLIHRPPFRKAQSLLRLAHCKS
jgi:ATP-dependent exoDNAse (exonuclease V) alpha subunit